MVMDELIACMPKQIQLNNEALKTELICVRHVSSLFIQIRFERSQNDLVKQNFFHLTAHIHICVYTMRSRLSHKRFKTGLR